MTDDAAKSGHAARLGARFIEWGLGLGIFGIVLSFGIIGHYIRGAQYSTGHEFLHNVGLWFACPWTLSVYAIQLGSVGMVVLGLLYVMLGRTQGAGNAGGGSADLWFCTAALIGFFCAGYAGYFVVDAMWPEFYYKPVPEGKNAWLLAQLACIVSYLIGLILARRRVKAMLRSVR